MGISSMNPQSFVSASVRKVLGSLTHVVTAQAVLSLTFDDGPDPENTPKVLDLLEKYRAHGTFFVVGQAAATHPDIVRRIAAGGHAIGIHSWDHRAFPGLSSRQRRRQIRECERALQPYVSPLFRPPYGEQTVMSRLEAFVMGYEVVGWNLNSGDWYESQASVMGKYLLEMVTPGGIVLFHDTLYDKGAPAHGVDPEHTSWPDRQAMLGALETVLDQLCGSYRFVTVPELLQAGRPRRSFWFKPSLATA
ncbi:MAG: polysaccharide deacetylase family protein [Nitrospira sp. CR1.1]|jgi:peptidoglycan/xylan/chitin deacetylase (PgdA/CDA1 family)|nr:polysaccharide deacetylase family protein [Nitrospira sp. CR1.1]